MDSGSNQSSPTQQSTTVSELPEWAKPYAQETLAKASAVTSQPYQTYNAPRIQGFTEDQLTAQQQARDMGPASQLGTATGLAQAAGMMGLGAQYQPGYFRNQFRAPGQYQPGQFSMVQAQAPELTQFQMGPAERVGAPGMDAAQMQAAQTGYSPDLQTFQMGPAQQVRTQSFLRPGTSEAYMSPYMQDVVDTQQREAIRQSQIAGTQLAGQATQSGAFGGSRYGLQEAERQRNLGTQLGQIQAQGLQSAFQQAQQQFNQEQQNRLAAQQANQQAGLQVGGQNLAAALGVQQLGTQTGLQTALANLTNQQQAAVQNQAAQLQAQGMNAQQAMQAALANQQAGLTVGQQNLGAQLGIQQLGAGQNLQAQLANQQALQAAQQAAEQSRQYGYGQAMTGAQQQAQYGQAAQQLGEQSRQFGANLGLQGAQAGIQAASTLGNLGQTQYGQEMGINQLLNQYGGQQQTLQQQGLTQSYQDFLNQQNYPYKQLGFMSDLIRGLPLGQQSAQQIYQAPGSLTGQLAGLGVGMYGMSRAFPGMFGAKEGGMVDSYAEGGVTDDRNVEDILSKLSDAQLAQAKQAAVNAQDQAQLQMIEAEMAQRASLRRGLGSIPVDFAAFMPDEETMAAGGIVAFAGKDGSLVSDDTVFDPVTGVPIFGSATTTGQDTTLREAVGLGNVENRRALEKAERELREAKAPKKPVKAEPTAKDREIMDKVLADEKAPAPQPRPAKSISEAARIVTDVAKTEVPKDDVRELSRSILAELNSAPRPEAEALTRMLEKAEKRSEDIKARSVGDALMKFGFGMAAGAARPGQARRSGIMGGIESAAAAAPLFAESIAENEKLQRAAEDNALKLRLENARYQSAVEQGNKQLAASLAGSISQRNLQQATLQEQIEQNARTNALKERELGIQAAYRTQAAEPPLIKYAERYMRENPNLTFDQAMDKASRAAGYSFRSEGLGELKRAELLAKLRNENPMYKALELQLSNAKTPEQQVSIQQKLNDIESRAFGKLGGAGVGSGAGQVLRFDAKGNQI